MSFAVSTFVSGVVVIEVWNTQLPVWAFVLALIICASPDTPARVEYLVDLPPPRSAFVYIIPIGFIAATANQEVGVNVLAEFIISYLLPGRPIAVMIFKNCCYGTMAQAVNFTSIFKVGHYMKIPPRTMFFWQVAATIIAGTVQLGVQDWLFSNVEDLCSASQKDGFICPETTVFGTASIIVRYIFP